MSEERMERKCVARSVPPKAAAGDSKKSSDAAHKPWPRSGKKREGGNSSRNEAPRRHVPPPRTGAAPARPRAHSHRPALGGEEGSGLAEDEAELGSVFVPGSKKQSLNHLLQFVYSPRGEAGAGGGVRRAGGGARPRVSAAHPHHAELYLQASCQFAVRAGAGDYSRHLVDPDLPVDWRLVEHVVVRSAGVSECPICLHAPVAARVTRCGHVFCWACALHYAAVHERAPPPCPVCAAPVLVAQLKSARLHRTQPPQQEAAMRLVRRARGSTLVEPAPERDAPAHAAPALPAWTAHGDRPYAKILTITTQQVREIMQRERAELSQQILDEVDVSELEYLERALQLLRQSERELAAREPLAPAPSAPAPAPPTVHQRTPQRAGPPLDWFDAADDGAAAVLVHSLEEVKLNEERSGLNPDAPEFAATWSEDGSGSVDAASSVSDDGPLVSDKDKEDQAKYFYFYQAEDGQHAFLHGVNVRLLTASWGALAAAPRHIAGRVLHTESACLTAQSRGRVPCAAHLPLYCPYELLELDLQPPHVTERARLLHADELERRARARVRVEREERRREQRAAAAGRAPAAPRLASLRHFPPALPPAPPSPPPSPPPPASPAHHTTALSFAKMAGASGAWRVRSPRAASPPPAAPEREQDAPAPPRLLCLSDAIEAALHAPAPAPAARKKPKRRVLFSTGVHAHRAQ